MIRLPSGSGTSWTRLPAAERAVSDLELDDLQVLLFKREQLDEPVLGHLVLNQTKNEVGRGDRRLDPEQLEMLKVAWVVHTGDDPLAAVFLLGDLADEDVVLVVPGHGDHEIGALDPGAFEDPQLGRVAVLDRVLEFLLDDPVAAVVGLDQRHLAILGDQLAGEVPADLSGAGNDHIHRPTHPLMARAPDPRPGRSPSASGRSSADPARHTRRRARGRRRGRRRAAP